MGPRRPVRLPLPIERNRTLPHPTHQVTRADIVAGASPDVLRARAIANGTVALRDEGWRLVREGQTTPEELARAIGEVDA